MVRKLTVTLFSIVWVLAIIHLGLLTNWFRQDFSLESGLIALTLLTGVIIFSIISFVAFWHRGKQTLLIAFLASVVGGLIVIYMQYQAFGQMPSFYTQQVDKSPIGKIKSQEAEVEYWIELKNPFAKSHVEYLVIKQGKKESRVEVPIFNGIPGGFAQSGKVEDWGTLIGTDHPDVFIFIIGKYLLASGRFMVNVDTGKVERMKN